MANVKISELPIASNVAVTDLVPIVQSGGTRQMTLGSMPFISNLSGAVARTLLAKGRDSVSVKDFGAAGDGVTDDTNAIQSAINGLSTSGALYFPAGTYKITSALTFASVNGVQIIGESPGSVTIKQSTNAAHIFSFTTCDVSQFRIENFVFDYSAAQTATATAIYFAGTSGIVANGIHDFFIRHCRFTANCFRAVAGNDGIQLAVWGWTVENCHHSGAGALVYINPTPSIGIPSCAIRKCYINALSLNEPGINMTGIGGLLLQSIEFNNGTIGGAGKPLQHILLTSCNAVVIQACRDENSTIAADARPLWNFASTFATISGAEFGTVNVSAGGLIGPCITADGGSKVSVLGMNVSKGTIGAASVIVMFNGPGFGILHNFRWVGTAGDFFIYVTGSADYVVQRRTVSADNGDAAKTLVTGTDVETQVWNTPLTANRAAGLSTVIAPHAGARFTIRRKAGSTGASTLDVGVGPLKSLATSQWCEVVYNGVTGAWELDKFGSL